MILVAAAIEGDFLDALGSRALSDQLADLLRRLDVGGGLQAALHVLLDRRGRGQRIAGGIVDDLGVDVQARTEDRQAQTADGVLPETGPNPLLAAGKKLADVRHGAWPLPYFFL